MASPLIIVNGKISNPSPTESLTVSRLESVPGELLTLESDTGVAVNANGVTIPINSVANPSLTVPADSLVGAINALSSGSSDAIKVGDSAGGSLSGTFPNPGLSPALNDPAHTTPGLRSIGTGATQAAAGNHTHPIATINAAGLLSATDKIKLDGLTPGVTDHGDLTGLSNDDHPQYLNNTRGDIRYSPVNHTHPVVTITTDGFMSAADKVKLDGIVPTIPSSITDGTWSASVADATGFKVIDGVTEFITVNATGTTIKSGSYTTTATANSVIVNNGSIDTLGSYATRTRLSGPNGQYYVESTNLLTHVGTPTDYFAVNSVAPLVTADNNSIYVLGGLTNDQKSRGSNKASSMLAAINASNPDFAFFIVSPQIISPEPGTALTDRRIPVDTGKTLTARELVWRHRSIDTYWTPSVYAAVAKGIARYTVRLATAATADMNFTLVASNVPTTPICDILIPTGQLSGTDSGTFPGLPVDTNLSLFVTCPDIGVSVDINKITIDIHCNASPLPSLVT